jgi:hypothetical protein
MKFPPGNTPLEAANNCLDSDGKWRYRLGFSDALAHLDLVAIAQKLDKMDSSGKSDALDRDHADLQAKIGQTRDLLAAADAQVKVGDDAKDILKLLQDMKSEIIMLRAEVKEVKDKQCCTIS